MTEGETVDVSVVIAARDEAANIAACIESVRWAREIMVVEDGSGDRTAEIARASGASAIANPFATIGRQRNAAIERAASQWVLVVDADERGSDELGREIARAIASSSHDAYRVPRRNFFMGREVRHGGWGRDKPVRLFKSRIRYNDSRVHEHVEVSGSVGELTATLKHEPYVSFAAWLEKLGRYSRWWAEDRFDRGKRAGAGSVVVRPPLRFVTMYLVRGGWMDGAAGAVLACMAATSVMAKYAQLWALGMRERRR
ncbi:MAG: glycosyltransferase family 2 protein [Gemmatimonadales bacterium]